MRTNRSSATPTRMTEVVVAVGRVYYDESEPSRRGKLRWCFNVRQGCIVSVRRFRDQAEAARERDAMVPSR